MDETKTYTKLSALVGSTFTVNQVAEFTFKKWDQTQSKMLVSPSWQEGYRKLYPVTTDKGLMDLGSGQLGSLLEAVFYGGKADLIGNTFKVKSNGKSGMDIRYYFEVTKQTNESVVEQSDDWPPEQYNG